MVQDYIKNYSGDLANLAFSNKSFPGVATKELIQQIESRQKAEKKLPTWYHSIGIYFPPKLNLEQTSSELTANYKSELVKGNKIADLTGGFGVDSYFFSNVFKEVHHFEINKELSNIASHNFKVLNKDNIKCFNEDGLEAIMKDKYDVIYIDPSRRNQSKGKVFMLSDCEPNVSNNIDTLLKYSKTILVKTSPMLDISLGMSELKNVTELHIVAVNNEVKELLWRIEAENTLAPKIKTINFNKEKRDYFEFEYDNNTIPEYSYPKKYLYEPNAAILKSGGFNLIVSNYNVSKLHKHSHLYTSDYLIDFPGRRFIVKNVLPYNKKNIKSLIINYKKANISTRNFIENVAVLRKKLKIKDGGDDYLFFTTINENEKIIISCSKA